MNAAERKKWNTHLRVHATHASRVAESGFSTGIVYASSLGVGQDLIAIDVGAGPVRVEFPIATAKWNDVRVGHFLEEFWVAALVWMQP